MIPTNEDTSCKLTQFAHGAGCGCKIAPSVLREILKDHRNNSAFPSLIVGNAESDDAAVYDLGDGTGLISTTDFFMPIVDNANDFGAIAAANAISDVYAMGGKPLMAIAILGWPVDKLPASEASQVLAGAQTICAEAGIPIAGGHTIDSPEPFFGLSVNGRIALQHLQKNSNAKAGDLLYLTKPLGVGILSTAARRGLSTPEHLATAVATMRKLNSVGEQLSAIKGVHAMTDVTGFGLLGHLHEMCEGSDVSANIRFNDVPRLKEVNEYLSRFIYPDMTMKTFAWLKEDISELTGDQLLLLCDPQTSGGLLIAVDPNAKTEVEAVLKLENCPTQPIGYLSERGLKSIFVEA